VVSNQMRHLGTRFAPTRQLALGFALTAAGYLAMLGYADAHSWVRTIPGLLISGAGSGLLNAALARLAVASVPPHRVAMGSGANNTARYVGSALGVAASITLARPAAGRPDGNHGPRRRRSAGTGAAVLSAAVALIRRQVTAPAQPRTVMVIVRTARLRSGTQQLVDTRSAARRITVAAVGHHGDRRVGGPSGLRVIDVPAGRVTCR
jgi:hypothetical protein